MKTLLPERIALIALSMVGRHEEPRGSNKGLLIQEFFNADYYKPNAADNGYAWCASFVCRIVQLSMHALDLPETISYKRPRTPSAFGLADWSRDQDNTTHTKDFPGNDIKRGDIVIFSFSHCGIAITNADETGYFETVEGNTNVAGSREGTDVVWKKGRSERSVNKVRNRIRFTI
jgi:hypothetical protein